MPRWSWIMALVAALAVGIPLACANGGGNSGDDDADDDASDDSGDDAGDDAGDDDTGGPPTYPSNHDATWDCYTCHADAFNGSPAEPHGHAYNAPTDCVGCHQKGTWTNDPSGPPAMNVGQDCLSCHPGQHSKTWQGNSECMVCHQ